MDEELKMLYVKRMIEAGNQDDPEDAHADADDILCEVLEKLGFEDLVSEFNKINKYYA